ncbi:hypothetical protein [Streptacidiphilus sp. MAP12-20]|uniref:hypothetical protein n=1 Tax=Streptacidiphilus sp. MAP12-20 TaxID=3156299 RepID=UPI0035184456
MTPAPQPELRERLANALLSISEPELAGLIATAGLAAVYTEWERTRVDLAIQEDVARAIALRIAHLTDEARRWKRRWAGAVAQARSEHADSEQFSEAVNRLMNARAEDQRLIQELRSELADYQLADSERQGAEQRTSETNP